MARPRTFAIGDVHGCRAALETLLAFLQLAPGDAVVPLGDYVDRGPDSRGVLDLLAGWDDRFPGVGLVPLRGNHEVMMVAARDDPDGLEGDAGAEWRRCGGDAALRSYAPPGARGDLGDVPDAHWAFLDEQLRPYHVAAGHLLVHANAYAEVSPEEQPDFMLYWESFDPAPGERPDGLKTVCGHTPQRRGRPKVTPHAVCIDTAACRGGWLSALCCETGEVYQANEAGETRAFWLDEA